VKRRIAARIQFTRSEVVFALGAAQSMADLRTLHVRVAAVMTPELAAEHEYEVDGERWTPAEGIEASPLEDWPHLREWPAVGRMPPWAPTAANVRARGTPTGRRGRDVIAIGTIASGRRRVEAEWEELAMPADAPRCMRFRHRPHELIGRVWFDGEPVVLEERVRLFDRYDRKAPMLSLVHRTETAEHVLTDFVGTPATLARVEGDAQRIGFQVSAYGGGGYEDYTPASGGTVAAIVFDRDTLRGFCVLEYVCDEGQFSRDDSPLRAFGAARELAPAPPAFEYASDEELAAAEVLAAHLSRAYTERLRAASDQQAEAGRFVEDLRARGYPMYSFDEYPEDFEIWCSHKHPTLEVTLHIRFGDAAEVDVTIVRRQ
jgi:hypothetical protein